MLQSGDLLVKFVVAYGPDVVAYFFLYHHFYVAVKAGEIVSALDEVSGVCDNHCFLGCPYAVNKNLDSGYAASVGIVGHRLVYGFDLAVEVVREQDDNFTLVCIFPVCPVYGGFL